MVLQFEPPLGSHHAFALQEQHGRAALVGRIAISFVARDPDATLQSGDQVQVWTNAPDTRDTCKSEWRSVEFVPTSQSASDGERGNESRGSLTWQVPSRLSFPRQEGRSRRGGPDNVRVATLVVPSSTSTTFEYTFRIVHADGNISWLGRVGANGTIQLSSPSRVDAHDLVKVGKWSGDGGIGLDGWKGFGLELGGSRCVLNRQVPCQSIG